MLLFLFWFVFAVVCVFYCYLFNPSCNLLLVHPVPFVRWPSKIVLPLPCNLRPRGDTYVRYLLSACHMSGTLWVSRCASGKESICGQSTSATGAPSRNAVEEPVSQLSF